MELIYFCKEILAKITENFSQKVGVKAKNVINRIKNANFEIKCKKSGLCSPEKPYCWKFGGLLYFGRYHCVPVDPDNAFVGKVADGLYGLLARTLAVGDDGFDRASSLA